MSCEERAVLLRDYLDRVRDYTNAVERLKALSGIPMAEYALAFKFCEVARELSQKAYRALEQHIAEHRC